MFNTRRSSKLPFYKSSPRQLLFKKRQKWFWRIVLVIIFCIFFFRPWHSSESSSSSTRSKSEIYKSTNKQKLEVQLRPPASSDARDFKELTIARETKLLPTGTSIPKIVHFVYGLRGPNPTLDLIHYTAIKSAYDVLKPTAIMFHYHYMPTGANFERAKHMLTLHKVPLVETVFDRPVSHYAHRADVVRLQVLEEYGGIYLDLDLISLKPVDHLLDREFIMAQEGIDGAIGLCNAMIMARPHSRFIQRWFATYATFDNADWNYHSVILPGKLAPFFPKEITVLNHTSFFWPLWDSDGLRTLYLEKSYDFSANLGTHIWESAANKNLMRDVSEQVIMEIDNSLYCQLRPFLLDGKQDPRPGACHISAHSSRSDRLVGHWPLMEPKSLQRKEINPMPAQDVSGNNQAGLIRNGQYTNGDGISLSGDTSYIFLNMPTEASGSSFTVSWWMKTLTKGSDKMAMVIQTDQSRICVTTHTLNLNDGLVSLNVKTIKRDQNWAWVEKDELRLTPSPYAVNDGQYHHYSLVIHDKQEAQKRGEPIIALYMDGHIAISSVDWQYSKEEIDDIVRGVWFGSIEPLSGKYQDPWDNTVSLKADYREIRIWERGLFTEEIMDAFISSKTTSTTVKQKKVKNKSTKTVIPTPQLKLDREEQEQEDEELLWGADDQLDD